MASFFFFFISLIHCVNIIIFIIYHNQCMHVGVVGAAGVVGVVGVKLLTPPHRILVSVRETSADWLKGVEPQEDPALKGKKDPDNGFEIKVNRRNVGEWAMWIVVTTTSITVITSTTYVSLQVSSTRQFILLTWLKLQETTFDGGQGGIRKAGSWSRFGTSY